MKASKFSDAQKAFILKQGDDGLPVAEICRKAGISQFKFEMILLGLNTSNHGSRTWPGG
ncbi:transposase [Pseudorhizobium halotolerans]|uniref:Transposase n=1 Tax=Pseudorhizobium halotolerans TaxID=1233081 RepID=A0ABM8PY07_9HYPH|nr:transposase [Pseudorhizobium halotolerans]